MEQHEPYQDIFDPVTGLYTLTHFFNLLRAQAEDKDFPGSRSIVYLDVANFKDFNQNYGFFGGNELLRGIAHELSRIFSDATVTRASADHFILAIPGKNETVLMDLLDDLKEAVRQYEKGVRIAIKAGIYFSDGTEEDPVFMIDHAKLACDHTKRVFDRDVCVYDAELAKKAAFHQYVMGGFTEALEKGYIKAYYQREVRALTGQNCGYEALARWEDPVYGMISPAVFVEVLEDAHLIHKLDIYMIGQVCRDIRYVLDRGLDAQPISVNLSRLDFVLCDIFEEVQKCRFKYDIPVSMLNIEITESAMAAETDSLDRAIESFREAGYKIWMDDFGSGYSSLNNLKNYQFDMLKIDMNFLREFETNPRSRVILASIVNMAKELGIHTLAEGVETQEQYDFLRSIGCEKLQGFLIGKPVPFPFDKTDSIPGNDDSIARFKATHPEPHEMGSYYDRIGEVNVLGAMPLSRGKSFENMQALAIAEVVGDRIEFLYSNKAYEEYLESVGIANLSELNQRTELENVKENEEFRRLAAKAEASGHEEESEVIINGAICTMRIQFLSRSGDRASFVVLARNLSRYSELRRAEDIRVAFHYMLQLFFRVDLFDEDGTAENIYLSSSQGRITDEETNAAKAVALYADRYIRSDDRARFIRFYNMDTILDRIKTARADYVSDVFHAITPEGESLVQSYMIIPFRFEGRFKMLSCCRNLDEMW